MSKILPTTKAQVSGHKFLVRRMQHALVLGDISMIHDPLASRRRALIFGIVAVVLIALGSGLLAWLRPDPDPGQAELLSSEQGQLYVRVDDVVHPVANLASARLILGKAAEPVTIGATALDDVSLGTPLGIVDAPLALSTPPQLEQLGPSQPHLWAACLAQPRFDEPPFITSATRDMPQRGHELIVSVGHELQPLAQPAAAYLSHQGRDWLVSTQGRALLPDADSTDGRTIRRILKLDNPVDVPPEFLNAFMEAPPIEIPDFQLLRAGDELWAEVGSDIAEVTSTQAAILAGAGAATRMVTHAELAESRTVSHPAIDALPATVPSIVDSVQPGTSNEDQDWLCADSEGSAVSLAPVKNAVELSGDSPARYFTGLTGGAVAVDTGSGLHIIEETGRRHELPDVEHVDALGVAVHEAAWPIVRLLPEASPLTRESAVAASY